MNFSKNQIEEALVALKADHHELQAVCRMWVAANGAKDRRIADLEQQVETLQFRVNRLTRLVGQQGEGRAGKRRPRRVSGPVAG